MKKYEKPTFDIADLSSLDVIRTSDVGVETTPQDDLEIDWN